MTNKEFLEALENIVRKGTSQEREKLFQLLNAVTRSADLTSPGKTSSNGQTVYH